MSEQAKEPLTKEQKIRMALLISLSSIVVLVIIFGFIFGSPYSIKKNNFSSFEKMWEEHYDRPTVLMFSKKSCPYCEKVYPGLSRLKDEYGSKVNFYYVDVQDGGEGSALYKKYGTNATGSGKLGTPTLHYFKARQTPGQQEKYATVTNYGGSGKNNTDEDIEKRIKKLLELKAEEDGQGA